MAGPRNDLGIYDSHADNWWSDDIRWVRALKNMVPARLAWFDRFIDWQDKRVLDLGCAGGFMAEALARRGAMVTGIDPAEQAIAAAQAHADAEGHTIRYHTGVGEDLLYDDGAFDAVVCVDVLEHVTDLSAVLAEIARVLKPGGRVFYDTINRTFMSRLAVVTMGEDVLRLLPKGTHDPAMFITPAELEAAMRSVGLRPGAATGLGPRNVDRRGDPVFGRLPFRGIIYMGTATREG